MYASDAYNDWGDAYTKQGHTYALPCHHARIPKNRIFRYTTH